jgi:nicotinamide-nucleotide amidase
MEAEIISIGNELLSGNTLNSNATFIARKLHETGVSVKFIQTIGDDATSIKESLQQALGRSQMVLITGGLGPTHDDITKTAITEYFGSKLVFKNEIYQRIQKMFEKRGIRMPEVNRNQALVPDNADLMANPVGTAPGMVFRDDKKYVFVMPGVPREMMAMIEDSVIPLLRQECPECRVAVNLFRTTGIAESAIYEKIERDLQNFSGYEIAFLPRFTGVDLRVIRSGKELNDPDKFNKFKNILVTHISEYIYAEEDIELEEVLGRLLKQKKITIAVAESLTGGLIQDRITNIPGSSTYYLGGVVTYSNEAKSDLIDVRKETLETYGAVSAEVAAEMALGVRAKFQSDLAISTTGIAGPAGATVKKPVGLIFVGVAYHSQIVTKKFQFGKDREINKKRSAQAALEFARRVMSGKTV